MRTPFCALVALMVARYLKSPLESDDIIEAVNNAKTTWTAGRNFHSSMTNNHLKILLGYKRSPDGSRLPDYVPSEEIRLRSKDKKLPKSFDARTKWSYCSALQTVRDQGPCGSCWAVSSASAFTDRLCIASKGSWNSQLSVQYLLTCDHYSSGCGGGYIDEAWEFFENTGLCTGGDYDSKEGCQPYTLPPCEHHMNGSRKNCESFHDPHTPACYKSKCYNKNYNIPFNKDIHKVSSTFSLHSVEDAMREIYTNGPIAAGLTVYEDFFSYKSGVYQHVVGQNEGGHAVKIIGWGVENGTDYWLVANSWNSDWGDNGYFKILRGTNECGIEGDLSAGTPIVD